MVANFINRKPVEALMDGYSASVISLGDSSNAAVFGSAESPGAVYYAIDQIHARMKTAGGVGMWQVRVEWCYWSRSTRGLER